MTVVARCRDCGTVISGGGLDGLCGKCLLGLALDNAPAPGESAESEECTGWAAPDVDESPKSVSEQAGAPGAEAPTASLTEKPGDKIGRYKLLQQIGEGGFGVVYMAEQREPVKRRVALKIIKLGMDTKHVVARFEAERQALAMMDHPNIAKVLDAGATDAGRPFFVMELV